MNSNVKKTSALNPNGAEVISQGRKPLEAPFKKLR
jgi:hypothetical protein